MKKIIPVACAALFINSLFFCIHNYLTFRSLWLDEAFLAINVRSRDFFHLFSLLDYSQQFPRYYLALVWALTKIITYDVWVLRLLPFLFGMAAISLWAKIIWDAFDDAGPIVRPLALLLLLMNSVPYHYAGDFKQYTGDMFFAGFGVWFGFRLFRGGDDASVWRWLAICVAWSAPILFSNTYILVLVAVGGSMFIGGTKKSRLVLLSIVAAVFLSISFMTDLRFVPPGMTQYWRNFFIQGDSVADWAKSFLSANARLLGGWWIEKIALISAGLCYVGFARAFWEPKGGRRAFLVTTSGILMIELIVLAALRKYPIHAERLCLFFLPFASVLVAGGIESLRRSRFLAVRAAATSLAAVFLAWLIIKRMPELNRHVYLGTHWENINPAVKKLDSRKSPYVLYGSATVAQVKAYPKLPSGFEFKPYESTEEYPWIDGDFYFLMAYPNNEPQELERKLKNISPHSVEQLDKHLFFFKKDPGRVLKSVEI